MTKYIAKIRARRHLSLRRKVRAMVQEAFNDAMAEALDANHRRNGTRDRVVTNTHRG